MRFLVVLSLLLAGWDMVGCKGGSSPARDGGGDGLVTDASDTTGDGSGETGDPCAMCSPNATCLPGGGASTDGGTDVAAETAAIDAGSDTGTDDADAETDATVDDASDGGVSTDGDTDAPAADAAAETGATSPSAPTGSCVCKPGFAGDGITCTDVAAGLSGLRWELPCGADLGGHVCAATTAMNMTTLKGDAGKTYNVTLRFRGVVEQRTYTGGTIDGSWVAGAPVPSQSDAFNIYQLGISSPAQTFYLNAGTSGIYNCFAIDYQETIPMAAGAMVTLSADAVDGHEIENVQADGTTTIIVPGVPPAPAAYNGQFIQMDVLSVVAQ